MALVPDDVGTWLREMADADETATIAAHLAACRDRGLTPSTLGSKFGVLRRAQRQIGTPLEDADEKEVRRWWRRSVGRAPATRAGTLTHLRTFYAWAMREDMRNDDPTRRIDAPRVRHRLPRPAPAAPVRKMLADLRGGPEWLPIALAVYIGLRVAEIAAVRPRDVERDDDGYVLRVRGKGGSEWLVPLPDVLAHVLLALPDHDDYAVQGRYNHGYTADGLSHAISRIMREHGVSGTAHGLRHLFGTRVHRRTRDLLATQRLMRHASAETSSGYAAMDVSVLREATDAVSDELGALPAPEDVFIEREEEAEDAAR